MSRNLDLLRAVAVITVFVDHLLNTVLRIHRIGPVDINQAGHAGVLIFFVHTALVLFRSMERSGKDGFDLHADFYIRRAFRIFPLSVITVLIVIAARIPWLPEATFAWPGWKSVLSNLLLIQNLTGSQSVTAPLWSLPYEIQMYAVLPALYLIVRRIPDLRFILWADAAIVAVFARSYDLAGVYTLMIYVPCFIAGTFAFRAAPKRQFPAYLWPLAIIAIVAGFSVSNRSIASVLGWLACAVLGFLIPRFREIGSPSVAWISQRIARYSYGVYLSHIPLMWLCFYAFPLPDVVRWASFSVLSIAVPVALFHWIEDPFIKFGKRLCERRTERLETVVAGR